MSKDRGASGTEAEQHLIQAVQHVEEAVAHLNMIVAAKVPGHDQFNPEFHQQLLEAYRALLFDVRENLA